MKRIKPLIFFFLMILSCSNDLEFNTPSVEGTKDYGLWKAENFYAEIDNDAIKIMARNPNNELLTLAIHGLFEQSYILSNTSQSEVIFKDSELNIFSTKNNGDGEIIVENYDDLNFTITGTYRFNAYSANGEVVNFIDGVFYNVPIAHEENTSAGNSSFLATVGSNVKEAEIVEAFIVENQLKIQSGYEDNSSIEIIFPEDLNVGSFSLNSSTNTFSNFVFPDGIVASSQYGTLTILEHNRQINKIKGSFQFSTGHPHNITVSNGAFIIYY